MKKKEIKKYVGIQNDMKGGMTDTAKIIRNAWVFGIIPETETCEGWLSAGIEGLWEKTNNEWEKYGFLVSNLPEELKQRFMRIQAEAIKKAKAGDWNPERDLSDDT